MSQTDSNPELKADDNEITAKTTIVRQKRLAFYQSLASQIFAVFLIPLAVCVYVLLETDANRTAIRESYSVIKRGRLAVRESIQSLILRTADAENAVNRYVISHNPEARERFQRLWEIVNREVRVLEEQSAEVKNRPRMKKLTLEIRKGIQEFAAIAGEVLAQDNLHEAQFRLNELTKVREVLSNDFQRLMAEAEIHEAAHLENSEAKIEQDFTNLIGTASAVLALSLLLTGFIAYRLVRRINAVAARCRAIAEGEGDLTQRFSFTGTDELTQMTRHFDLFLDKTFNLVSTIASSANQVVGSTGNLNKVAVETARATEVLRKNAALEQLSMDRCQIAVVKLEEGMKNALERVNQTVSLATESQDQAKKSAEHITDAFEKLQRVLDHTKKVGEHIGAIAQIANQTKVLSINAAIEASKAGDHGSGFYHVAEEVRGLSERVQNLTQELNEQFQSSNENVSAGSAIASTAAEAISRMMGTMISFAAQVQDMGKATQSHAESVSQVFEQVKILTTTIDSSGQSTNAVARCSKTLTTEARNLNGLIKTLEQTINQFRLAQQEEPTFVQGDGDSNDNDNPTAAA